MPERREVLRLEGLRKSYNIGQPNEVEVLHGLDLRVDSADFAALVGPSGSGKSTLLNQIGLLDSPTAGELYLLGQPTRTMDDEARTAARGKHIGFVFQFHHLIQAFTALDKQGVAQLEAHLARHCERGGTVVHLVGEGGFQIGPDSVGYRLTREALVFGGQTLTITDIAVAKGLAAKDFHQELFDMR